MPKKQYSPALVVDPTSQNHLVRLHPNQDFNLRLSSYVKEPKVYLTSEFLRLVSDVKNDESITYRFEQVADFTEWSQISSAYLGEVSVLSEDRISSVCALLESEASHHPNVVTVVNPTGTQVKVEPYQVLEVVVYEPNGTQRDRWDLNITPGSGPLNLVYEQLGHEIVYPGISYESYLPPEDVDEVCLVMPRAFGTDKPLVEHHYWFRCKYESISAVMKETNGVFDAGKISFMPGTEKSSTYHNSISIQLNLRERNRKDAYKVLFFPKRFQVISSSSAFSSSKGGTIYPTVKTKKSTKPKTTTALTTTSSSSYKTHQKQHVRYGYTKSIYVPNVSLVPKSTKKLDSGCKIAWCVKTGKKKKKGKNRK